MGLFSKLQKKQETVSEVMLGASAKGTFVPMEEIPDEVFRLGVLGACCGINPSEGKVYAPMDGTIVQVADTLHAIGIEGSNDVEVLLHVGVDTVGMNGEGFACMVKEGDTVKKGQLLLTMDLERIKAAGYSDTVIIVITNSGDFAAVEAVAEGSLEVGEDVLRVNK